MESFPQSRYIPFTQQNYCCVAACLQMVMYHRNIPLVSQEELSFSMGLTVPEADRWLFVQTHEVGTMPAAGWGTQIAQPGFTIGEAFAKLHIPLQERFEFVDDNADDDAGIEWLRKHFTEIQDADIDCLVCFSYGALYDDDDYMGGHLSVFDCLAGDIVRLVDPNPQAPKLREVSLAALYAAMRQHTAANYGGLWFIESTK